MARETSTNPAGCRCPCAGIPGDCPLRTLVRRRTHVAPQWAVCLPPGEAVMERACYFRAKAAQRRHFADICTNIEVRRLLDELAEEFEERAAQIERDAGTKAAD